MELRYIFKQNKQQGDSGQYQKVIQHIEKEKQKHIDAEERDGLLLEIEELDKRYKGELNRCEKLVTMVLLSSNSY
jgi:hypothetical protein